MTGIWIIISSLPEPILTSMNAIYRRIIRHVDSFINLGREIYVAFSCHKLPFVTNIVLTNATF